MAPAALWYGRPMQLQASIIRGRAALVEVQAEAISVQGFKTGVGSLIKGVQTLGHAANKREQLKATGMLLTSIAALLHAFEEPAASKHAHQAAQVVSKAMKSASEAFNLGNLSKIMKEPVKGNGPEENTINALKDAMDAIMGANEIVHATKGQLTKRDAPRLKRYAMSLENAAVEMMSAAKQLP